MNHAQRKARWLAASVALAVTLVLAWSVRADLPPMSVGAARADLPLQATEATPSAAPTTEPAAPTHCRMVADALQVQDASGQVWAWSTLQNVSIIPVSLSALQAGWNGGGSLARVVLDSSGAQDVLFDGQAVSPASVGLESTQSGGEPWLAPGATVRLGLRFEGVASADLAPGPTVLHLRQGCSVALHAGAAGVCGLQLTDVRVSANDKRRVVLAARNRGTQPARLQALDVYWPDSVNGSLRSVVLGGQTRRELDAELGSPAVIVLERVFGEPVVLETGESLAIWLEFDRDAAERPYVVTAMTADGCQASSTTWLDAPGCGLKAGEFETRGLRARLRVSNLLPAPQTLTSLDLFWPVGINGALIGVTLDGVPVWRGREESSPAALVLTDAPDIAANQSALVEMSFAPVTAPTQASTSGDETIAGDDYTVVLGLSGGCRLVYTTLKGPAAGCSVTAGSLLPREGLPEMEVSLTNTGGQARLRRMVVSWPSRNGPLRKITLGDEALYEGSFAPGEAPFSLVTAHGTGDLASQSTLPLRLAFDAVASRTGYALSLSFVDAGGAACTEMVITPPKLTSGCNLSIDRVEKESERLVDVFVRNDGRDDLELAFVNVDWPDEERRSGLLRVLFVHDDTEYVLWSGEHRQSPARIALDATRAAFVSPGETMRLRLQFDLLASDAPVSEWMKLTVGTVEGCQAFYPSDNRDTRPVRESFNGLVLGLPPDGLWGWWTIEAQLGAQRESRQVLVKSTTRMDPPTIHPLVGDLVLVEAIAYDDGWHAESLSYRGADQRVQLVGQIQDIDRSSGGSRPGWIRVSGYSQRLWIVPDTYIDGRLVLLARVTVIGTLNSTSGVTAISITVLGSREELVTVRGTIQSARDLGDGFQLWTLDKYHVRVDSGDPATRLEDPRGRLPAVGERLEVKGWLTTEANLITATQVTLLPRRSVTQLSGTAVEVPSGTTLGTWTVRDDSGKEVSFAVESSAVVDTRSAPAAVGVRVRATLEDAGSGRWSALYVQTDWPDG